MKRFDMRLREYDRDTVIRAEQARDGEWVRYEDVMDLLDAIRDALSRADAALETIDRDIIDAREPD